jgi:uncharacterized protein YggE
MKKKWLLFTCLALAVILATISVTGCTGTTAAQTPETQIQISQQPEGIWVSGSGEISATPDIVTLRLGIVSQEASVEEAQTKAATAMADVMTALADNGVDQKDIQTGSFSINQRSRWDDQTQTEVVTGYQVTNMVTVKIRVLVVESYTLNVKAGRIIDAVAQAGGDLTRINSISFSVEDPTTYYQQAREKAMIDAQNKAEQLAGLAGITLGEPTYVAEGTQTSPVYTSSSGITLSVPAPTIIVPPISEGEVKITLTVQVAYATS